MRRLAERPAELPAEVRGRKLGGAGEGSHVQGLPVAGVNEVLRAEKMPGWMRVRHRPEYAVAATDLSE